MKKIIQAAKRIWDWIGASSPDSTMEGSHHIYGVDNPQPGWYDYISKVTRVIFLVFAVTVPVVLYATFDSAEGSAAALYLLSVLLALFLLLIHGVAIAHKKYRFAQSLPTDLRSKYAILLGHRGRKFLTVLGVAIIVTAVFLGIIFLVDKITGGRGLF